MAPVYRQASRPQKQEILAEFVTATGYALTYFQADNIHGATTGVNFHLSLFYGKDEKYHPDEMGLHKLLEFNR